MEIKEQLLSMIEHEKTETRAAESYQDAYGACACAMGVLNVLTRLKLVEKEERILIKKSIWDSYDEVIAKGELQAIDRKFVIHAWSRSSKKIFNERNSVLFLARDKAFAATLPDYFNRCQELGAGEAQLASVKGLIDRVTTYQLINAEKTKVPDVDRDKEAYLFK